MTVLKEFYTPSTRHVQSGVTKTRDRSSSHVLWIGTDRDPFVFALSSHSGVRPFVRRSVYPLKHRTRVRSRVCRTAKQKISQRTRRRHQKDTQECSNISDIC